MKPLLAAAILSVTAMAPPNPAALPALGLQIRDLPAGFVRTAFQPVTNHDIAWLAPFAPHVFDPKTGRITGYGSIFRSHAKRGITYVDDEISSFHSSGGASLFVRGSAAALEVETFMGIRYRVLPSVHVGDRAIALTATYAYRGRPLYTDILLYFCRGALSAAVHITGWAGTTNAAQLVGFARIVDRRFQAVEHHTPAP